MKRRNLDKHTTNAVAKMRILRHIVLHGPITLKSQMGYVAYPDYSFKSPQAAAFAVARLAAEMHRDKLINQRFCIGDGVQITQIGRAAIAAAEEMKS